MSNKMNTFKKSLTVAMLLLFINVACSSSINANISKASVDSDSVDLSSEICGLVDDNVHLICFVESGYVRHKNVNCSGFYISAPFNFCIGSVELELKGFRDAPEEPRLTIKSYSGKTINENNISVSLKGFIGRICPTGNIYSGFLKGFAMITSITPLENQHSLK